MSENLIHDQVDCLSGFWELRWRRISDVRFAFEGRKLSILCTNINLLPKQSFWKHKWLRHSLKDIRTFNKNTRCQFCIKYTNHPNICCWRPFAKVQLQDKRDTALTCNFNLSSEITYYQNSVYSINVFSNHSDCLTKIRKEISKSLHYQAPALQSSRNTTLIVFIMVIYHFTVCCHGNFYRLSCILVQRP